MNGCIDVSLIATIYNESDNINAFLNSYLSQARYAREFIIVDGGSTDGTIDIVREFSNSHRELNINLIIDNSCSRKYSAGPIARGRNVAIEATTSEYIAATDAGCILADNWLEELIKPFEFPDVDVVSGWYKPLPGDEFQEAYARAFLVGIDKIDRDKFMPSSRSIAFKKNCWRAIGGYPDKTYNAEDTMYNILLKRAGFKFHFNEKAIVYWSVPKSLSEIKSKHYQYGYGDGQYGLYYSHYLGLTNCLKLLFPLPYLITRRMQYKGFMQFKIAYAIHFWSLYGFINGCFNKVAN